MISLHAGNLNNNNVFYNISMMTYEPIEDVLYISDQIHRIYKVTNTGNVSTFLNFEPPGGVWPKGVAVDKDRNVYVAMRGKQCINRYNSSGGGGTTIASIESPMGITMVSDGSLYVTSAKYHCIYKLTPDATNSTYTKTIYAGNESSSGDTGGDLLSARFNCPHALYADVYNNIYVYDAGNRRIKLIVTSAGKVTSLFGGRNTHEDGLAKVGGGFKGAYNTDTGELNTEVSGSGVTADAYGNVYITDYYNGFIRKATAEPVTPIPTVTKEVYEQYWENQRASAAQASSAVIQQASSALAQIASSPIAQMASSAVASSAVAQVASSAVAQVASSALAQQISGARESSATAQVASSAVAQTASSALAQQISGARESSAVAQVASSAVAQTASSALAQQISGARASSATAQVASSAQASSAVAQVASSALAQQISGAEASSATAQTASSARAQTASSALAQIASSAVAQTVSSALAQEISGAQASSATAQVASSAVVQKASSARQQQALLAPVSVKDSIVESIQAIQSELTQQIAILYSQTASESDKQLAQETITTKIADLDGQWFALSNVSARIFAIAPLYQDRVLQTWVPDRYLESKQRIRMYDTMRKDYISIDINGYIVDDKDTPTSRTLSRSQGGGALPNVSGAAVSILSTDVLLSGDLTLPPNSTWSSYFDTVARRYFYVNTSTGAAQYEHPFLPVFSGDDQTVFDTTSEFLPSGWLKLKNAAKNLPYYFNVSSTETSWAHPAPPPNPSTLRAAVDPTLFPAYKKYISTTAPTTGKPFYVNSVTKEAQWNFPDSAFDVGPSSAQQASSALAQRISGAQASSATAQVASSAVAQVASSALAQSISGAQASSATAQVASSAVAQVASSAVAQVASSAQQQAASSAMYQEIEAATVSYRYILITVLASRVANGPVALCGFFLNKTRVPAEWNPSAQASAVDPVSLAPIYGTSAAVPMANPSPALPITTVSMANPSAALPVTTEPVTSVSMANPSAALPVTTEPVTTVSMANPSAALPVTTVPMTSVSMANPSGGMTGGSSPITYGPIDTGYGNIFNKGFDTKVGPITPGTAILIDNTVPISFNAYYFGLEAIPDMDMMRWTVKGSKDGITFVMVDDKSSAPQTTLVRDSRNTFIEPIELNVGMNLQASAAFKQFASSAQVQAASSAVAQTVSSAVAQRSSSALAQSISGAQASSATAQVASSALAQRESSALAQSISGAQASSATAQFASSAQQQRDSSAQQQAASSSIQQRDSSAQQQAASSSFQQRDSSAQQQAASSSLQQRDSSAQQQTASSSVQQRDSSAQQQRDSSAQQQTASSAESIAAASSAVAQTASSALAQKESSAVEQSASSAYYQSASSAAAENSLKGYIDLKNTIKSDIAPIKTDINTLVGNVYSKTGTVTMSTLSSLRNKIAELVKKQGDLKTTGESIMKFKAEYQDPSLQTVVPDPVITTSGVTKIFDTLRNRYVWLDANKKPIPNPVSPMTRAYPMRGGTRSRPASKTPRKTHK
jgi:hypothetical protein